VSGSLAQGLDRSESRPPAGSRIAVVGGCGGFGRALVESSLALGLRVAVLDLPGPIERNAPKEGVELTVPVDAADEGSVHDAVAALGSRWSGLDGLVNLAGFATTPPLPAEEVPIEEWDRIIAGNLRSTFLMCRTALPLLRAGVSVSVVNMSSGMGYKTRPGFSSYTAAKAGVSGLTRSLALEFAPQIRVNGVAPGAAATEFLHGGTQLDPEKRHTDVNSWFDIDGYVETIPLRRLCDPIDVVGAIFFLLGPGSSYITGQTLHINGGREMY
jgi:3-oxoacyl-[acyl-carrier protein] reductase